MATHTAPDHAWLTTSSASGAQLRSLRPDVAATFFERVIGTCHPSLSRGEAWGAFKDRSEVVGACAVAEISETSVRVQVAVVPERRHLGIGRELVDIAIAHATRQGARILIGSHEAGAAGALGLIASVNLPCARRVRAGQAEVALFLPMSEPSMQEGCR